jgi:hypothetical protein
VYPAFSFLRAPIPLLPKTTMCNPATVGDYFFLAPRAGSAGRGCTSSPPVR